MQDQLLSFFSTWSIIRAAGIAAYFMLFLSVTFGLFYKTKLISPKVNQNFLLMHQTSGWLGLLFAISHGVLLHFDTFIHYPFQAIFIPFSSPYKPILSGLGTISLYSLFLLLLSSDMMKIIGKKVWKSIHYLALPAYVLAFIHGIWLGTDSKQLWAMLFYGGTGTILVSMVFIRLFLTNSGNKKQRISATKSSRMTRSKQQGA